MMILKSDYLKFKNSTDDTWGEFMSKSAFNREKEDLTKNRDFLKVKNKLKKLDPDKLLTILEKT